MLFSITFIFIIIIKPDYSTIRSLMAIHITPKNYCLSYDFKLKKKLIVLKIMEIEIPFTFIIILTVLTMFIFMIIAATI